MLLGEIHHLGDFGFGNLKGIDAADAHALLVDMEHDAGGFLGRLRKELLQHMDDEFHGRVVVIQQQHLVEAGLLGLGLGAGNDPNLAAAILM